MHAQTSHELSILIIEDSDSDAALMLREVARKDFALRHRRIETAAELREALCEDWHIILSDFRLPQFSAITALDTLKASGKDIPFVIVSQAIGEGIAVELMRAGAADYVMKSSLKRLGPVVEREIREAHSRAQARAAVRDLEASEINFRLLAENSGDVISRHAPDGTYIYVSPAFERIFGYQPQEQIGFSPYKFIHADDVATVSDAHEKLLEGPVEIRTEYRLLNKAGAIY